MYPKTKTEARRRRSLVIFTLGVISTLLMVTVVDRVSAATVKQMDAQARIVNREVPYENPN